MGASSPLVTESTSLGENPGEQKGGRFCPGYFVEDRLPAAGSEILGVIFDLDAASHRASITGRILVRQSQGMDKQMLTIHLSPNRNVVTGMTPLCRQRCWSLSKSQCSTLNLRCRSYFASSKLNLRFRSHFASSTLNLRCRSNFASWTLNSRFLLARRSILAFC